MCVTLTTLELALDLTFSDVRFGPTVKFVIRDLWAESAKLYELAEQDELAKHALKKATKSKRGKGMVQNAPATDSLARCVAGREAWVRKEQAVSLASFLLSLGWGARAESVHASTCRSRSSFGTRSRPRDAPFARWLKTRRSAGRTRSRPTLTSACALPNSATGQDAHAVA